MYIKRGGKHLNPNKLQSLCIQKKISVRTMQFIFPRNVKSASYNQLGSKLNKTKQIFHIHLIFIAASSNYSDLIRLCFNPHVWRNR